MQSISRFVRATVLGGVFFLLPLALLIFVLRSVVNRVEKWIGPIVSAIDTQAVGGVAVATLVACLLIVIVCFLAGLAASTAPAKRLMAWLEDVLLGKLPPYRMLKGMMQGLTSLETSTDMKPALARIEDAWQLAFVVERLDDGLLTVFVPQAPTPMSGSVYYLTADRVRVLDIPVARALLCVKHMGLGSKELLAGRI
jgi:uncharacterized membrane protein